MKNVRKWNVSTVLLIAVLLSIVGYQAIGDRPLGAQSAVVATVNLQRVIDGLEQRQDAARKLQQLAEQFQAERSQREAELKQMQEQLREMLQGAEQRDILPYEAQRLEEQMVRHRLRYQAWLKFISDKHDVEYALMLQDLFRTIRNAAAKLAQDEGYDLILLDDSTGEFMINPESRLTREAQVRQQMTARSILYAREMIDVSNDLIQRMNNEFRNRPGE